MDVFTLVTTTSHRRAKENKSIRFVASFLEALMFGSERFQTLAKLVK